MGISLKALALAVDEAVNVGHVKPLVDLYLKGKVVEQALILDILAGAPTAARLFDEEMAERIKKGEA